MTRKVTVTETLGDLSRYDSNGLRLYATPGADKPYWSNNPSFMYDECVATTSDFAEAAGYDSVYLETEEQIEALGDEKISIEVELPDNA